MDLFIARGFEKTTAADIAEAVGLTERTFFRHFTDKREVLFGRQESLGQTFLEGMASTPPEAAPLELIHAGLTAVATLFPDQGRGYSRRRQIVISENPALQERELLKLAGLATEVAQALRERGVPRATARLAAESGVTVFGVAFGTWIADGEERSFLDIETEVLDQLVTMAAGAGNRR
jgi:AcrR family transcriptional regulator